MLRVRPLESVLCRAALALAAALFPLLAQVPAQAAHSGSDLFIPAVARAAGLSNSNFYSTLWITNPNRVTTLVEIRFYETNQSNTAPVRFTDSLRAGETRKYDNVLESRFGRTGTSGSLRVLSSLPVVASSRTYDLASGGNARDSKGLFFSGTPASEAITLGRRTVLQGVSQGGAEDFRYNFGVIETTGSAVTVEAVLVDASGSRIASKIYQMPPFGRVQFSVSDIAPNVSSTNAIVDLGILSGNGAVIAFGTQIQNGSNDSSGVEMSFGGVTALSTASVDRCGADALGTQFTIGTQQYIIVETLVLLEDGRGFVMRYPEVLNSGYYGVQLRRTLHKSCRNNISPLLASCDYTQGSICGYQVAYSIRARVTNSYSASIYSATANVYNGLEMLVEGYLSLDSSYETIWLYASISVPVSGQSVSAYNPSLSFVDAPYTVWPVSRASAYEADVMKFFDHVSVRAR